MNVQSREYISSPNIAAVVAHTCEIPNHVLKKKDNVQYACFQVQYFDHL